MSTILNNYTISKSEKHCPLHSLRMAGLRHHFIRLLEYTETHDISMLKIMMAVLHPQMSTCPSPPPYEESVLLSSDYFIKDLSAHQMTLRFIKEPVNLRCLLTGASLSIKMSSSTSSLLNVQFLLTGTDVSLTF